MRTVHVHASPMLTLTPDSLMRSPSHSQPQPFTLECAVDKLTLTPDSLMRLSLATYHVMHSSCKHMMCT